MRGGDNNQREILTHCFFLRLDLIFAMFVTHERNILFDIFSVLKLSPFYHPRYHLLVLRNIFGAKWNSTDLRADEEVVWSISRPIQHYTTSRRVGSRERWRRGEGAMSHPAGHSSACKHGSHRRMRQTPQQPRQVPTLPRVRTALSAHHVG